VKRTLFGSVIAAALTLAFVAQADARPRPAGRGGKKFQANKTFGLGLMLGAPSGLTGKFFLSRDTALDFGVGVYEGYRDDGIHLHFDFLWHPVVLATNPTFWLPLYFGVGARYFDHNRGADDDHLGVRVPLGISFDFQRVPLDVFIELAFVLDFIVHDNHDRADLNAAVGIRYYFN
jgi:hypothetical protein